MISCLLESTHRWPLHQTMLCASSGRLCSLKWLSDAVFFWKIDLAVNRRQSKHHSHFFQSVWAAQDKTTAPAFCSKAGLRKLSHFRLSRNKRCASYPALSCRNTLPSFRKTKRKKRHFFFHLDAPFRGCHSRPGAVWSACESCILPWKTRWHMLLEKPQSGYRQEEEKQMDDLSTCVEHWAVDSRFFLTVSSQLLQ